MTISPRVRVWPARLPNEPTPIDGHVGHVVHVLPCGTGTYETHMPCSGGREGARVKREKQLRTHRGTPPNACISQQETVSDRLRSVYKHAVNKHYKYCTYTCDCIPRPTRYYDIIMPYLCFVGCTVFGCCIYEQNPHTPNAQNRRTPNAQNPHTPNNAH